MVIVTKIITIINIFMVILILQIQELAQKETHFVYLKYT